MVIASRRRSTATKLKPFRNSLLGLRTNNIFNGVRKFVVLNVRFILFCLGTNVIPWPALGTALIWIALLYKSLGGVGSHVFEFVWKCLFTIRFHEVLFWLGCFHLRPPVCKLLLKCLFKLLHLKAHWEFGLGFWFVSFASVRNFRGYFRICLSVHHRSIVGMTVEILRLLNRILVVDQRMGNLRILLTSHLRFN